MFQTIYSGYIKYGPKYFSVHGSHTEGIFQIGAVKLNCKEAKTIMADLKKFIEVCDAKSNG